MYIIWFQAPAMGKVAIQAVECEFLPSFNDVSKPTITNYQLVMRLSELGQETISFLFHSFLFTHQQAQQVSLLPAVFVVKVTDPHLHNVKVLVLKGKSVPRISGNLLWN